MSTWVQHKPTSTTWSCELGFHSHRCELDQTKNKKTYQKEPFADLQENSDDPLQTSLSSSPMRRTTSGSQSMTSSWGIVARLLSFARCLSLLMTSLWETRFPLMPQPWMWIARMRLNIQMLPIPQPTLSHQQMHPHEPIFWTSPVSQVLLHHLQEHCWELKPLLFIPPWTIQLVDVLRVCLEAMSENRFQDQYGPPRVQPQC